MEMPHSRWGLRFQLLLIAIQYTTSSKQLQNYGSKVNESSQNTKIFTTLDDSSGPLSHSSGVFEDYNVLGSKRNFQKPSPSISEGDVQVLANSTDLSDTECAKSHRYCSFESIQKLDPDFEDSAINGTDLHSPYYCSCAEDCLNFGDCCWDAPVTESLKDQNSDDEDEQEASHVTYSCVESLPGQFNYVWSKCPKEWVIEDIKAQCEQDTSRYYSYSGQKPDYLSLMPVTSLVNNITYKNIFCAACNNQKVLVAWKAYLQCGTSKGNRSIETMVGKHCPVHFGIPPEHRDIEKFIFKCVENTAGSSCVFPTLNSSDPKEILYAKKCEHFFAPVYGNTTGFRKTFKNKFCAFCHGELANNLQCETGTKRSTPFWGYTNLYPHKTLSSPRLPSFSMVLDIDFSSGGTMVGSSIRCPAGAVFDPFTNKCRNVVCGENYVYSDGLCLSKRSTDNIDVLPNRPTLEPPVPIESCAMIIVSEVFEHGQNDSILLRDRDMILQKGEYQVLENGTVMICMDPNRNMYVSKFDFIQSILTIVCLTISLICLMLKMLLFFIESESKKIASKAIVCLSLSLFVAQLLFIIGVQRAEWGSICTAIGITTHYAFIASFFWCNVLAYDIWHTFYHSGVPKTISSSGTFGRFFKYSCYAWMTPLAVISVAIALNFSLSTSSIWNPGYGNQICWISNRIALLTFFAGPLAMLLLINLVFFVSTAIIIYRASKATKMAHENTGVKDQMRFSMYAKLGLIMGLTWIFGLVAPFMKSTIIWCFFIVLNGLQGAFIFIAFTRFERVKRKLFRSSRSEGHEPSSSSSDRHRDPNRLQFGISKSNLATSNTNITNV